MNIWEFEEKIAELKELISRWETWIKKLENE